MSIEGKVIAITGASSGIGRATAKLLASRGATVILGARRERELISLVDDIAASGGKAAYRVTDVSRKEDLRSFVELALHFGNRLDVLINNAGIGPISRFDSLRVEDWDAMIDVNLRGTLYGIGAALPVFVRQQTGHVVNVVSTAGLKIVPTMGVYAATKNAVRTATEALRQEAGPHLRVTEVSPGFVATEFSDSIGDVEVRKHIEKRKAEYAISAEAVARAIAFAIEQSNDVEISSIVIRPTAQD